MTERVPPPQRRYAERPYRTEIDVAERVRAVGSLVIGAGFGGLVGVRLGIGFVAGAVPGAVVVWFIVRWIPELAARWVGGSLEPSGATTPRRAEYSQAQALEAQGKYGEAADAYEVAAVESEGDPEPYLRLARLYRDKLHQPDDALAWFQRARTDAELTSGQELLVIQEIVDLYTNRLGTPRKAIPELLTLSRRFPDSPAAQAAERELAEIRDMLARERDGGASFTAQYLESRRRG